METVTIGCRLPNGYTLEVGYTVTAAMNGKTITQYSRGGNYQRFTLLGTNAGFRKTRIRLPATLSPEPYLNQGVPKALWDQWVKEHPNAWALKSGNVFLVESEKPAELKAVKLDSMSKPAPLAPLDPSKPLTVGGDKVETAKFDED